MIDERLQALCVSALNSNIVISDYYPLFVIGKLIYLWYFVLGELSNSRGISPSN